jgi:hypothetical protein
VTIEKGSTKKGSTKKERARREPAQKESATREVAPLFKFCSHHSFAGLAGPL